MTFPDSSIVLVEEWKRYNVLPILHKKGHMDKNSLHLILGPLHSFSSTAQPHNPPTRSVALIQPTHPLPRLSHTAPSLPIHWYQAPPYTSPLVCLDACRSSSSLLSALCLCERLSSCSGRKRTACSLKIIC